MTDAEGPRIVTLCGSTRFYDAFVEANFMETMRGNIVLAPGVFIHVSQLVHGFGIEITKDEKEVLDKLHMRKILMSDEVLVINVGGYIGESTRREIEYATRYGKRVRYWEATDGH